MRKVLWLEDGESIDNVEQEAVFKADLIFSQLENGKVAILKNRKAESHIEIPLSEVGEYIESITFKKRFEAEGFVRSFLT